MTTLRLRTVCGMAALCALGVCASAAPNGGEFVIRHARIFDGVRVLPSGDVWVRNGVIKAVGPHLETPPTVAVVDGSGKTLLPGLIDAHVHTMGQAQFLASALALGVTTEIDMGSAPGFADRIEREQAEGQDLDLADLRSSRTQPTAPNGHGTEYGIPIPTLSSPEEAQPLVDALLAEGADFIGEIVYDDGSEAGLRLPTLSKETLRAVIDAAHRRGQLAVVHVLSLQGAKDAIAAGADGLAHVFADRPVDDEFVSLVAERHAFVMPTLSLLASLSGESQGPSLARDPRLEPYLSSEAIADLNTRLPKNIGNLAYAKETVRRLRSAGVPILAGTDAHNPGTAHGASLLGELRLLVDSGLTPDEALAAATSVNAAFFRLNDRGRIAAGQRADLVLVAGDPTVEISDIDNVVAVWKLGARDDRESYRAAVTKKKEEENARRRDPPPAGSESGLVSDFEDGTASSAFGLGWSASTGRILGGREPAVQLSVVDGGAGGSRKALEVSGEIAAGIFGWAGAIFYPGPAPMTPVNLSGRRTISFRARGDGRTYQVILVTKSTGSMPLMSAFTAASDWTTVNVPLSGFGTDASDVQALIFAEVAIPGRFAFEVDDIRLER
jgi:imidazolonepropionase-like amidohydrolase